MRFWLAWAALWIVGAVQRHGARRAGYGEERSWRDEWLFAAMGFCGIFCYCRAKNGMKAKSNNTGGIAVCPMMW